MEKPRHSHNKDNKQSPALQPCFSGVSGIIFTLTFISILIVVFLMEGPFLYLYIIYTLYVLIIAAFVFQILLDLGIWEWARTGSPSTRYFLSRFCPVLCISLSIPPVGLLWHTKNGGGFTTKTSDISLIFTILVVALELFHLLVTVLIYKNYQRGKEDSVRFSYSDEGSGTGRSPASSIRSSRIDFLMNRSRNSLASLDSGFTNGNFGSSVSGRAQRETIMDVTERFWEHQRSQQQDPNLDDFHTVQQIQEENLQPNGTHPPSDSDGASRGDSLQKRGSDFSAVSDASFDRRDSDRVSFYGGFSKVVDRGGDEKAIQIHEDYSSFDTHSVASEGGENCSRKGSDYDKGFRVEEEMVYQPGLLGQSHM